MIFRKRFVLIPLIAIAAALVWSAVALIHKDWRAGYSTRDVYISAVNWPMYYAELAVRKFWRDLTDKGEVGLPQVRLYLPARSTAALMADIPDSTKVYQRAYMLQPDGSLERVQVRYRGDNPINWLFEKKSLRVKLRKSRMRDGVRVFNYGAVQSPELLGEHIAFEVARRIDVTAPKSRPVELFINDRSRGVMAEIERYDETFLRNRNIMPVNLYKGEQYNADLVPGTSRMLFENGRFWIKISAFNRRLESDRSDLDRLLSLLGSSETNLEEFDRFLEAAPLHDWAKFAAYQVLSQSTHNDNAHNMRLLSDVWRGQVLPLPYDAQLDVSTEPIRNYYLDGGSNEVLRRLHQSSDFLNQKYRVLFDAVKERRVLASIRDEIAALRKKYLISAARDVDLIYLHYYSGVPRSALTLEGLATTFDARLRQMSALQNWLAAMLSAPPQFNWAQQEDRLSLTVDGLVPATAIEMEATAPAALENLQVRWDRNANHRRDNDDPIIPSKIEGSTVTLDMALFANRIERYSWQHGYVNQSGLSIQPARFEFLLPKGMKVRAVRVGNPFNGKQVTASKGKSNGYLPTVLNRPVFAQLDVTPILWSGDIAISRDRVIRRPVVIEPGTRIRLARGASLVFRAKVQALGAPERPIVISAADSNRSNNPESAWGVFALQGKGTQGSALRHMHISHGSGDDVDSIPYTGMLSIHDTSDIEISNVRLGRNFSADDSLHLVYAENVRIREVQVENANGDGIDIDISQVVLDGGRVSGSKNDGIDLMSSRVLVVGMEIARSGDKGISVGERTQVLIHNVDLNSNTIGVESKDGSRAVILHANFIANDVQLSAFLKNWRYGAGGRIDAHMVRLEGRKNIITAKGTSRITLTGSHLAPAPADLGKGIRVLPEPIPTERLRELLATFPLEGTSGTVAIPIDTHRIGVLRKTGDTHR